MRRTVSISNCKNCPFNNKGYHGKLNYCEKLKRIVHIFYPIPNDCPLPSAENVKHSPDKDS